MYQGIEQTQTGMMVVNAPLLTSLVDNFDQKSNHLGTYTKFKFTGNVIIRI